ncbi:GNAT family N-acetyltransferase [Lentilactobacillus sunkii]|nr:GNAT family N-acetyltransferase [Lentilactobacillus sunkii]
MELHFESAQMDELQQIMLIEHAGFSEEEAATRTAMRDRIKLYPETFVVAKVPTGQLVGYVVGPAFDQRYLTDDLYAQSHPNHPEDPYQTVLSLAVDPDFQHHGIASQLLTKFAKVAKAQGRSAVTLTCLETLVSFYENNGYKNEGVSASSHADETWYNMVLPLT